MKTKEELNALKEEIEIVSKKLSELNENELEEVTGGLEPAPFLPANELSPSMYHQMFEASKTLNPLPNMPAAFVTPDKN